MPDTLCLRLLGPAQIEYADQTVRDLPFGKALALLGYLAVRDRPASRERLADLFWPDKPTSRGRANLSWLLHHLAPLAPSCLEATPDAVRFSRDPSRSLDLDQFTALVENGDTAALAAAATLYRGDLMEGLHLDGCADYEVWLTGERERWRRRAGRALSGLVAHHVERQEHREGLRCARRLLALEPWQEEAHRQVMRLLALDGQRSAALRQYDQCAVILERELGLPPSQATTALYEAIRTAPPAPETSPLVSLWQRPPAQADRAAGREGAPIVREQKRLITVLCADVSVLFHRSAALSPEDKAALVERFLGLVESVQGVYGGRRTHALGERAIVAFGLEQTHESDAERALCAALALERQCKREGLDVRLGVNTGEIYAQGATSEAIAGSVVEQAIRLAETGPPGRIWVGEVTHRLTRRLFEWGSAGEEQDPGRLLVRPRAFAGTGPPRSPLIGRDTEWATLQSALDRVRQGEGQMVSLIGEAGIGKSRLIAELRHHALAADEGEPAYLWLQGRCLELGTATPYAPLIDILVQYFGWSEQDDDAARFARMASALQALSKEQALSGGDEIEALLCRLLHLPPVGTGATAPGDRAPDETPEQVRRATFLAIRDLFLALSRRQPLVLIFDNVHWADDLSLDLISLLMESVAHASWLLLCAYRPEREHRSTHLGRIAARKCGDAYSELHLHELSGVQSEQLLAAQLAKSTLPSLLQPTLLSALRTAVLARAQGNPFFIEETLRALIDAEILYADAGRWCICEEKELAQAPWTVQSIVLSRVDRLSPPLKDVLQTAAVIGSVFERRVLAQTLRQESELDRRLWALEEAALIYPERALPQVEYRFRHDLAQAAIYANLPRRRCEILHGRVASALESLYSANRDEVCEQIAFHYDRAGLAGQAIPYLLQAGRKAQRNSANEAAIAHLRRGLELLQTLPDGAPSTLDAPRTRLELELLLALGVPLVLTRGHNTPEVRSVYSRARALCTPADLPDLFQAVLGLRRAHQMARELPTARDLGKTLLDIAGQIDDPTTLARAHMMQSEVLYWLGAFAAARDQGRKGLAVVQRGDPRQKRAARYRYGNDTRVGCGIYAAMALWHLGYPGQAAARVHEMLALAESLSHPFTLVFALRFTVQLDLLFRDTHKTLEDADRLVQLTTEQGFALFEGWARIPRGWALVEQGQTEEGLAAMQKGLSALRRTGAGRVLPYSLAWHAEALGKAGRVEEGLRTVERGLALAVATEERCWEAEMHRLRGELLLANGRRAAEAEPCFHRALEVARAQGARAWELRAAMSLGRLLARQGNRQEARALVQEIYGRFGKGLDVGDLREAKALLIKWADGTRS
jgi:adenylate cyclase